MDDLPSDPGIATLLHWTMRPSDETLIIEPSQGPRFVVVESGDVTLTVGGTEHRLATGATYVSPASDQEIAMHFAGPGVASLYVGYLSSSETFSRWDENTQAYTWLLEAESNGMPGGSGRLVAERLTLPPGSALPSQEASDLVWTEVAAGTLNLTLDEEGQLFPGEEWMIAPGSLFETLMTRIPAGTRMTMRNAGDEPLVLYRMTLIPDVARATPLGTPVP